MMQLITYKRRLFLLFGGAFLFTIILYQVAISETVLLAKENKRLKAQISKHQNAPEQIQYLKKKLQKIQQLTGRDTDYDIDVHQELLGMVTQYCQQHQLVLKEFPKTYDLEENGYLTKTAKINVEGDFIRLLQLTHFLEIHYKYGKIVATEFNAAKNIKTKKRNLTTTIYIQNIKALSHEENT